MWSFRLFAVEMQVRSDVVEKKKETHTGQKSDSGRYDRFCAFIAAKLDTGYEQRPYRCCHHYSRGKSQQGFLYDNIEVLEKYDENKKPGAVLEQEPKYGTQISPDSAVTIYVNSYKGDDSSDNLGTDFN